MKFSVIRKLLFAIGIVLLSSVVLPAAAQAERLTWEGLIGTNSNWGNAFNWRFFEVPDPDGSQETRFTLDGTGLLGRPSINVDVFPNVKSLEVPINLFNNKAFSFSGNRITVQDLISNRNGEQLTFNSAVRTVGFARIEGSGIVFNNGIEIQGGDGPTGTEGHLLFSTETEISAFVPDPDAHIVVDSAITGTGRVTIDKTFGEASIVVFRGVNTYTGSTTLELDAKLRVDGIGQLPTNQAVSLAPGARLEFDDVDQTITALQNNDSSVFINVNPNVRLSNGSILTIGANNASSTFRGLITGTGGITKIGSGDFTLASISGFFGPQGPFNSYTGPTRIEEGSIILARGTRPFGGATGDLARLPEGADLYIEGNTTLAKLVMNDSDTVVGALTGAGTIETGVSSGTTLFVGFDNKDATFSGTVEGAGRFLKIGRGTFDLQTGTLNHTGDTDITAGQFQLGTLGSITQTASMRLTNSTTFEMDSALATLNVLGDVTVQDNSFLDINRGTAHIGGQLIVSASATIDESMSIDGGIVLQGGGGVALRDVIDTQSILINGNQFFSSANTFLPAQLAARTAGTEINVAQDITVGTDTDGIFSLQTGAQATADRMMIATQTGGAGTVNITGITGRTTQLTINNGITIGGTATTQGGTGTLILGQEAITTVNGGIKVWSGGRLNLAGGELTVDTLDLAPGSVFAWEDGELSVQNVFGSITQDGGTFSRGDAPGVTSIDGDYNANAGAVNINSGGRVIVGYDLTMERSGSGTVELNFTLGSLTDPFIEVLGNAELAGSLGVDLDTGFTLTAGDAITLIDIGGTQAGVFNNYAQDDLLGTFNGVDLFLSYIGGDGNDVVAYTIGPASLIGDYNGDGFVSQADLDLVLLNWGASVLPAGFDETAISGGGPFDNLVSQNELDDVLLNWGNGTPPSLNAIPEPTSAAFLALSGMLLARHRRRST